MKQPRISVVTLCGRTGDHLRIFLQALSIQTLPRREFEVLLTFDGIASPRALELWSRGLDLRVQEIPRSENRAAARNRALNNVRGDIIVSLDADMIACPRLLEFYSRAGLVAGVGRRCFVENFPGISAEDPEEFLKIKAQRLPIRDQRERIYSRTEALRRSAQPFWAFFTCNCSFPAEAARALGGFDENLKGWGLEDQEFGFRLWRNGIPIYYLPKALAIHIEHPRDRDLELRQRAINKQYLIQKHGSVFASEERFSILPLSTATFRAKRPRPPMPP